MWRMYILMHLDMHIHQRNSCMHSWQRKIMNISTLSIVHTIDCLYQSFSVLSQWSICLSSHLITGALSLAELLGYVGLSFCIKFQKGQPIFLQILCSFASTHPLGILIACTVGHLTLCNLQWSQIFILISRISICSDFERLS